MRRAFGTSFCRDFRAFRGFSLVVALAAIATLLTASRGALALPPTGPIVKGPWLQHVTPTSAVVRVEVDPPAPVILEIGAPTPSGAADSGATRVIESREARALHSIVVKALEPATRYAFKVRMRGAAVEGALTTAPRDDSGAPFRFLVYGDNRSDEAAHAAVLRAMVSTPSDFLVHTGDFVENGSSRKHWQTFFDIEAPLLRDRCVFSCVGNHELVDGAGIEYVRYFGPVDTPEGAPAPAGPLTLEQLSGTFRWSSARFFLVNGMVSYTATASRAWLEKALVESDNEAGLAWRIVVVHHGLRSSGPHGDNKLLVEAGIPELLRAHKVDLIVAGHDHIYERGTSDGLPYLISGGGGAPTYRIKKAQGTSARYESVRHFIDASATASVIQFSAIRPDGSTIERCALQKGTGWDCDAAPAPSSSTAAPSSSSTPASTPSWRCGCRTVGESGGRSAGYALVLVAAAMSVLVGRARRRG